MTRTEKLLIAVCVMMSIDIVISIVKIVLQIMQ